MQLLVRFRFDCRFFFHDETVDFIVLEAIGKLANIGIRKNPRID